MNLKESRDGHMGDFGGGTGKKEMMQLHYNMKNKRKIKKYKSSKKH